MVALRAAVATYPALADFNIGAMPGVDVGTAQHGDGLGLGSQDDVLGNQNVFSGLSAGRPAWLSAGPASWKIVVFAVVVVCCGLFCTVP